MYDGQKAVDDISFEVKTGEILGFLGPNGAGKTTTMKIITCYMPPNSGTVEVDDYNIFEHSLQIRQKVGYFPETAPLYHEMNVIDYLYFVAELRGIPSPDRSKSIRQMVEVCGLSEIINKDIAELSKGFRQRVGLAQAMIHDPEILILDEPTIGLDPNQIVEIRNLIKELGKEKTVILSTHILPEVQATCDRVLIIHKGKLVADGTPDELQASFKGRERIYLEVKAGTQDLEGKFTGIGGLEEITVLDSPIEGVQRLRIESQRGVDLREDLFKLVVKNKWTLLEMRREQVSLEDVFRELTREE